MNKLDTEIRHIVVVSDLHVGSTIALCPPRGIKLDEGQPVGLSNEQRTLWAWWRVFWDTFVPSVVDGHPYAVVVNGDAIDNDHHNTYQVWGRDPNLHVRAAAKLLRPELKKAARHFIVRGTEAHAGSNATHEESLARQLAGVPGVDEFSRGDEGWEPVSHWELLLQAGPYRLNFAHHIGTTSSAAYEHSALSRELVADFVECARWGDEPCDFAVRSHRHRASAVSLPTERGLATVYVTPGWQLKTGFVRRLGASMRRPQIGGVVIYYDDFGLHYKGWTKAWPRQAALPLTPRAARRMLSVGTSSSRRSGPTKAAKGRRRQKS